MESSDEDFIEVIPDLVAKDATGKASSTVEMDSGDDDGEECSGIDDTQEEFWTSLCKEASSAFFRKYGLISHQINSYNDFISNGIRNVFQSIGEIRVEPAYDPSKRINEGRFAAVKFGEVTLERPSLWVRQNFAGRDGEYINILPRHARLQNLTYSSRLKVVTSVQVSERKLVATDKIKTGKMPHAEINASPEVVSDVLMGRIPVLVKSNMCWMSEAERDECDFDQGGYFIIKGTEKTFIAQEQPCLKRLWISSQPNWVVSYRSSVKRKRLYIKMLDPPKENNVRGGGEKLLVAFFLSVEVPIWILFFAMGVRSDREVVDMIELGYGDDPWVSNVLIASIYEADSKCSGFRRSGRSLDFIDRLIRACKFPPPESTEECLSVYLFPNTSGPTRKARFLAYMVKCLLRAYTGRRKCDNKDDFRNKRLELASELLEREMKVHLRGALRRMTRLLQRDLSGDRELHPINHYLDASIITNGLLRSFSTGAWSHPFKMNERMSGIVATLRRTNPLQTVSDMRKTRQQVRYAGKAGDARYPHPSHWGRVCFLSTPDGENCGLVKNLAATGVVSTNVAEPLLPALYESGMETLVDDTVSLLSGKTKIFLNGDWVGVCDVPSSFTRKLRDRRRSKRLSHQVEVKNDVQQGEVRIFSDSGRILRPLLVVENVKKLKGTKLVRGCDFGMLLDSGIVEFVGVEEEEDCVVAWSVGHLLTGGGRDDDGSPAPPPDHYTHCELDMSFLLGLSCGLIPFANHNHARRVLYQSEKHSSQAIGFPLLNARDRVDTLTHNLYYPQVPLFRTSLSCSVVSRRPDHRAALPRPEFYNGQNAIVAVNVHLGYNQEDSLVMNRSSLDRGMFRTEHFRSYKADADNAEMQEKRRGSDGRVRFARSQSKFGRVDSLDDDGFPYVGAALQTGDIIVGRVSDSDADLSIRLRHTEHGVVHKVVLSANDEGKNFAAVSLRQVRTPCLGDKFSSMHGQKGVIGFLEDQENFPFTRQGIVPDVVINPHAFPSRQTPGQLLEAALGKGIACRGSCRTATPFSAPSVEEIADQLHSRGFCRWGSERVVNGRSGGMLRSLIFMGPTFYQRLIHMAEDKVKFRNTGPVHPLTRQPVADRKRFGGIKFGEMERDCLIAHGAAANLHERLFTLSDSSRIHVCRACKNMAYVIERSMPNGAKLRGPYCRFCESAEDIVRVNVPYGAKLLSQELFSMGISLKFETKIC